MPGPRYTQEHQDRALGALMASAVEVGGQRIPNFRAVERQMGISARTLERWWEKRNVSGDAELCRAVSRARGEVAEEGAGDFLREMTAGIIELARFVLHPHHRSTELVAVPGREGRDEVVRVVQLRGAPIHHAAKALQIVVGLQDDLRHLLQGEAEGEKSDPLAAARAAAARTGLVKVLEKPASAGAKEG